MPLKLLWEKSGRSEGRFLLAHVAAYSSGFGRDAVGCSGMGAALRRRGGGVGAALGLREGCVQLRGGGVEAALRQREGGAQRLGGCVGGAAALGGMWAALRQRKGCVQWRGGGVEAGWGRRGMAWGLHLNGGRMYLSCWLMCLFSYLSMSA